MSAALTRRCVSSLVSVTSFCVTLPLGAQPIIDQEHVPVNNLGGLEVTFPQPVGQTFTVGIDGTLVEVVITQIKQHRCPATDDLRFELYETDGSIPVGPPIAFASVPPSDVPAIFSPFGPVSFAIADFEVEVSIGDILAIGLFTDAPSLTCTYAWNGEVGHPSASYTGGYTIN